MLQPACLSCWACMLQRHQLNSAFVSLTRHQEQRLSELSEPTAQPLAQRDPVCRLSTARIDGRIQSLLSKVSQSTSTCPLLHVLAITLDAGLVCPSLWYLVSTCHFLLRITFSLLFFHLVGQVIESVSARLIHILSCCRTNLHRSVS